MIFSGNASSPEILMLGFQGGEAADVMARKAGYMKRGPASRRSRPTVTSTSGRKTSCSDDAPLCISIRRSLPSYQLIIEVTA
jgi:hypothetical protein